MGSESAAGEGTEKRPSLLRQRAFGGLWTGSVASSFGSAAGLLAINWLVYTVTKSALDVGFIGVAGVIPRIVFGVFAGTLADRYSKLRLMIVADAFRAGTMVVFALTLALFGFNLYVVLAAVFLLGMGQSLFRPSINSFLPQAVRKEQLGAANGLFTAAQEVTSIAGSPIGGILIAVVGVAATLAINGASYVVSALMVVFVALSVSSRGASRGEGQQKQPPFLDQLRGGFTYVNGERGLLKLTLASFGANFFLSLFFTFLVIYVTEVLHQSAFIFGAFGAAGGAGFGLGSLLVGRLHPERRFGVWFAAPWGMAGLAILGLVFFPGTVAATAFVFVSTFFGGFGNTAFFTGVQSYVPHEVLGRYLSIDEVGSLAASPAGQLAGGLIIAGYGINADFVLAAVGTAVFAFGLLLFSDVRSLKV
ncbi:MAG: MFS transporter [Nitrososphaerota archaeon]|nr:MFS transporter [Nitrososphaerota archaeon]MDG6903197.1 MFS transporter [Nitrososphaerota archaeon]MDG6911675.1 MFS transporter [Nitrososphaerota archaeon]MDG6940577.1 MFS transporter [Nitrososphaerota archaeon]MDG6960888.1 MFS transporter [Nitrososphaerota archaeon]